jgi:transposase
MRFIQELSNETIHLLQRVYKQSRHHRVRQRAHCILLSFQGYTTDHLAGMFTVDRITIYHWLNAWEQHQFPGLYDRKGPGRPPIFNADQKDQIREWAKQSPKNLNKVRALIHDEFGFDVSKQTVKRVLKSFQFVWKRVRKRVKGQPDPELYQERKQSLEILLQEDREGIIDLRYFDETGFCLVPYGPYAWQESEERISLPSTQSKRLNVLGFMNTRNELEAYCFEGSVDSEVVIHCVDAFCKAIQGPTVVVIDNASIHTSEVFQEQLPRGEQQGLDVFYLPPYSPELNLIEILWRFMKYEWIEFWAYNSGSHLVAYVEDVIINFGMRYKIHFV